MDRNDYDQATRGGLALADNDGLGAGPGFGHWTLVLILSTAASAWIAVSLGQDVSWDVLNYHLYSGYAFLHKPILYDFGAAQVQSFLIPSFTSSAISCWNICRAWLRQLSSEPFRD